MRVEYNTISQLQIIWRDITWTNISQKTKVKLINSDVFSTILEQVRGHWKKLIPQRIWDLVLEKTALDSEDGLPHY